MKYEIDSCWSSSRYKTGGKSCLLGPPAIA